MLCSAGILGDGYLICRKLAGRSSGIDSVIIKTVTINEEEYKVEFHDLSSKDLTASSASTDVNSMHLLIIAYRMSHRETLEKAESIAQTVGGYSKLPIFIVGTFEGVKEELPASEGEAVASKYNATHVALETTAPMEPLIENIARLCFKIKDEPQTRRRRSSTREKKAGKSKEGKEDKDKKNCSVQ